MDQSPLCPTLEDHEVKTGRSSILKPIKPRAPFQELSFGCSNENNEVTIRQRRVSFSGKNIVKEFCSKTHSQQITHVPTYEESFQISDTSESNLNSTSKDSSINQSFFAGKLDCSEESNVMEESMDITSNSVEALKPGDIKNAERHNVDFENSENSELSANMSLTTVLPRFNEARIKRNHDDQNVESDVPIRYANRCSRLYNADSSGMDFTEAVPSLFPSKVSVREFETSMEMTNVSRLPVMPFLSRDLKSEMELTEAVPSFPSSEMNASMEMTNVSRLPMIAGMEKPKSPACVQPRKSQALDFSPAPIKNHSEQRSSYKPSLNLEISDLDLTNTESIQKPRPSRKTKSSLAFAPQSPLLEESFTKIQTEDMDLSNFQPADSSVNNEIVKPRKSEYAAKDSDCSFATELKNDDMDISSFTAMKFRDSELSILEPKIENELIGRASVVEVKDMDFSVSSKKPDESCLAIPLEVTENDGKRPSVPDCLEQTEILEAENDDEKRRQIPLEFRKSKFSMQSEQLEDVPKRSISPKFSLRVSLFDGDSNSVMDVANVNRKSVGLLLVEEAKLGKSKVSLGFPLKEAKKSQAAFGSPISEQSEIDGSAAMSDKCSQMPKASLGFSLANELNEEANAENSNVPQFNPRKSRVSVGIPVSEQSTGSAVMDATNVRSLDPRMSKASLGFPQANELENEDANAEKSVLQFDPRKSKVSVGIPLSEQSTGSAAMDMSNVRSLDPRMSKASLGFPLAKSLNDETSSAMDMSNAHSCIDPRKSKASLGFSLAKEPENEEASAEATVPHFDPRKSKVSVVLPLSEQSIGSATMDMSDVRSLDPRMSKASLGFPLATALNDETSSAMDMSNAHSCIDPRKSKASLGFPLAKESENEEASPEKTVPHFDPRKSKVSVVLPLSEQSIGSAAMDMSNVRSLDPRMSKASLGFQLAKSLNDETSSAMDVTNVRCLDPRMSKASLGFPPAKEPENEEASAEETVPQFDPRKSKVSVGLPLSEQSAGSTVMDMSNMHPSIDSRKSKASFGFPLAKELENDEANSEKSVPHFDRRKSKVSVGLPLSDQSTGSAAMDMSNVHSCIDPRKSKASLGFPLAKELKEETSAAMDTSNVHFCIDPRKSKASLGFPLAKEQNEETSAAMDMSSVHSCIDPRKSKASLDFPLAKELENDEANAEKSVPQFDRRKSKSSVGLPFSEQSTGSAAMDMSNTHFHIDPRKSKASFGFPLVKELENEESDVQIESEDPPQLDPQSEISGIAPMDMSNVHSHVDPQTSKAFLGSTLTKEIENEEHEAQCEFRPQLDPRKSKICLGYEQSAVMDSSQIDSGRSKPSLGWPQKELENEEAKTENFNQKSKLMEEESFSEQFENDGAMDVSNPHDPLSVPSFPEEPEEFGNTSETHQISEKLPMTGLSKQDHSKQNITADLETVGASMIESLSINEENSPVRKDISILVHSPIHHEDSPKLRIKRKKTLKPAFDDDSVLENLEAESSMCDKFAEVMDVSAVEPEIEKLESSPFSPPKPMHTPKTPSRTEIVYEEEPPYEIRMKNIEFMKKIDFIQKSDSEWMFKICPFFFVVIDVPLVEISNQTSISKIFSWCNPVREKDPHLSFVVYNFKKKFDLSEISRCCKHVEQLPQLVEPVKKFWMKIKQFYNSLNMLRFSYPYKLNEDKLKFSVRTLTPLVMMDVFIDLSQWETYLGPESISVVKRRGDINDKIIKCLCSARSFIGPYTLVEYVDSVREFCRIVPKKV